MTVNSGLTSCSAGGIRNLLFFSPVFCFWTVLYFSHRFSSTCRILRCAENKASLIRFLAPDLRLLGKFILTMSSSLHADGTGPLSYPLASPGGNTVSATVLASSVFFCQYLCSLFLFSLFSFCLFSPTQLTTGDVIGHTTFFEVFFTLFILFFLDRISVSLHYFSPCFWKQKVVSLKHKLSVKKHMFQCIMFVTVRYRVLCLEMLLTIFFTEGVKLCFWIHSIATMLYKIYQTIIQAISEIYVTDSTYFREV